MTQAQVRSQNWSYPSETRMLTSADGTEVYATMRGTGDIAVVVAHGFSGGHRHGSHARLLGWFEDQGFRVFSLDQRGHGKSGGHCTLGHFEPMDFDAVVSWAREYAPRAVFAVGFSMGAATVLRHAALSQCEDKRTEFDENVIVRERVDGVVTVGAVAQWFYRGSNTMRSLHLLVGNRLGRWFIRERMGVRLHLDTWPDEHRPDRRLVQPLDPEDCMRHIAPLPVLLVHGTRDNYFPVEHAQRLFDAAGAAHDHRATLWVKQDMGHAESGTTSDLVAEISNWIKSPAKEHG